MKMLQNILVPSRDILNVIPLMFIGPLPDVFDHKNRNTILMLWFTLFKFYTTKNSYIM